MSLSTTTASPDRPSLHVAARERHGVGRGAGYLFLLPWFLGFVGLTLGPALISLYLSFTNYDLLRPPVWVGLANYARIATGDSKFAHAIHVTLLYVLLAVPLKLSFALFVAMA